MGFIPFRALVDASTVKGMNTEDLKDKAKEVTDRVEEWTDTAVERAGKAGSSARECVARNPWASVGVATVVGVLIGVGIGKMIGRDARQIEVEPT